MIEWFETTHGSLDCEGILDHSLDEGHEYPVQCGNTVLNTFNKVQEILATYSEDPESDDCEEDADYHKMLTYCGAPKVPSDEACYAIIKRANTPVKVMNH